MGKMNQETLVDEGGLNINKLMAGLQSGELEFSGDPEPIKQTRWQKWMNKLKKKQ